ncbi:glycosyltransferase family 2 protein [Falsirhodobacter sp. alg1]|uniref:glycosyltransferase family 2 protein n=1 Tax=Falsirhodobacter sp. alg1 TaxID=1472418 RepID=UPI0005F0394D|nr:glycosyltransferase family 2 protein [Falsirhodobacter sp. alg1]
MAEWGICTTAKAPLPKLKAFLVHHLSLGAAHIWLHLDDPEDPALAALSGLDRVTAISCDAAYWGRHRPARHQNRQSRNMQRVYAMTSLPWIAHIDVDEFILPSRPITEQLDGCTEILLRMRPWEALHDSVSPPDIYTARHFRAPIRDADDRTWAFGDFAEALPNGSLSHSVGKAFFRTGVDGMEPRLHGGFVHGERITGISFADDMPLLHFHAEDPAEWHSRLAFRQEKGAYLSNPVLSGFLAEATDDEIEAFYKTIQNPDPDIRARLKSAGLLIEADLALADRIRTFP